MTVEAIRLADMRVFAGLPPEALRELADSARLVEFADGEMIAIEGDEDVPVLFVAEGAVRVYQSSAEGRQQTLATLGPSEALFVVSAYSVPHTSPASATSVGRTRLVRIDQGDFRRIAVRNPAVATALLRDLSDKLRRLTGLTHDLSLRSIRGRLARFLVEEGPASDGLTQQEIAARLGTVREVVSRTLREFVREGLIRRDGRRIEVLDPDALETEIDEALR